MRTWWILGAALVLVVAVTGCSKNTTYNPTVVKSDVPSLEQQTVSPGLQRAAQEFLETGKRKWRVGDLKLATENFRKSLQKNPYNFEAHYWLGVVERDHQNWEKAGQHFAHAVQNCPPGRWGSRIRVDWGYTFELQGQKGMAAKQYDLALMADPNYKDAQAARQRVLPLPNANVGN